MLVLTRKLQQQIHIGDQIKITILRVSGNTVRVGIEAPRDLRVMRAEIAQKSTSQITETPRDTSAENAVHEAHAGVESSSVEADLLGELFRGPRNRLQQMVSQRMRTTDCESVESPDDEEMGRFTATMEFALVAQS